MDLSRQVLALQAFTDVAEEKINRLEQQLAQIERRLQEAETEIRRLKSKA